MSANPTASARALGPRDLWLLLMLTIVWGLNWPVMKIGVTDLPPLTFRAASMLIGIPLLALIIRARGQSFHVAPEHRRELFVLALTNMTIWFILAMYGVKLLSSGRAAILGYTMPIWSALIAVALYREATSPRLWVGVVAAGLGVSLLLASEFGAITGSLVGTAAMLAAACCWAFGTHRMRRRKLPTPVLVITFWSLLISLIICGALALLFERSQVPGWPQAGGWFAILYNAILIFCFAQLVWFRLATILPPVASGLSVMLIPVVGVFSGVWLLQERVGWADVAALASLLVAIATVLLPARSVPGVSNAAAADRQLPKS